MAKSKGITVATFYSALECTLGLWTEGKCELSTLKRITQEVWQRGILVCTLYFNSKDIVAGLGKQSQNVIIKFGVICQTVVLVYAFI